LQFFFRELLQELFGSLLDNAVELCQDFGSFCRYPAPDYPAILKIAMLTEKFLRLQTGEQAGNVGFGSDHHAADGRTSEPIGTRGSQDAQHVELRHGESSGLEPLLHGAMQAVGGTHQIEQRLLLGTGEALRLLYPLRSCCHIPSFDAVLLRYVRLQSSEQKYGGKRAGKPMACLPLPIPE
jgi:hypothetical protein